MYKWGWKEIKVQIITTILNSNERKYIEKYKKQKKVQKRGKKEILDRSMCPSIHTFFSFFHLGL